MCLSSAWGSFGVIMCICLLLQVSIIAAKNSVQFDMLQTTKRAADFLCPMSPIARAKSIPVDAFSTVGHFVRGVILLFSHPSVLLLTINTMLTNIFVYPLNSFVFPMFFKQMPKSQTIDSFVDSLGLRKEKAWMNFAALVSFGGVFGPIVGTFLVHIWKRDAPLVWAKMAMRIQIAAGIGLTLGLILVTDPVVAVTSLFLLWSATMCANNVFTIYLSSMAQTTFNSSERGRVLANMFTLFSLASMAGNGLLGWATDAGITVALMVFVAGIAVRCGILAILNYAPLTLDKALKKTD